MFALYFVFCGLQWASVERRVLCVRFRRRSEVRAYSEPAGRNLALHSTSSTTSPQPKPSTSAPASETTDVQIAMDNGQLPGTFSNSRNERYCVVTVAIRDHTEASSSRVVFKIPHLSGGSGVRTGQPELRHTRTSV